MSFVIFKAPILAPTAQNPKPLNPKVLSPKLLNHKNPTMNQPACQEETPSSELAKYLGLGVSGLGFGD